MEHIYFYSRFVTLRKEVKLVLVLKRKRENIVLASEMEFIHRPRLPGILTTPHFQCMWKCFLQERCFWWFSNSSTYPFSEQTHAVAVARSMKTVVRVLFAYTNWTVGARMCELRSKLSTSPMQQFFLPLTHGHTRRQIAVCVRYWIW